MKRIISYDSLIVEQDVNGDYFMVDEEESCKIRLIKSKPVVNQTENELLNVDFDYDVSGETDYPIDGHFQYMYFEILL